MKRTFLSGASIILPVLLAGFLAACSSTTHEVSGTPAGDSTICTLCYEETVRVGSTLPTHVARRFGRRTLRRHACPACKAEMEIYLLEGRPMIRCEGCAPEGVPCDRCRPRGAAPAGADTDR